VRTIGYSPREEHITDINLRNREPRGARLREAFSLPPLGQKCTFTHQEAVHTHGTGHTPAGSTVGGVRGTPTKDDREGIYRRKGIPGWYREAYTGSWEASSSLF